MTVRLIVLTAVLLGISIPVTSAQILGAPGLPPTASINTSQTIATDDVALFFDDSRVHEVRIYFADPDWYDTLYEAHANDPADPYFPARFEAEGEVMDPVGVRFKGNSSFGIPTVKKSFKIDFDEDNPDLTFMGVKKLNLNNSFKDPTLLREKLFLDFAAQYAPTIRAVHTRVYVNDVYWGLYTAVEQVDKTFAQSRFGSDEDGNLFKADPVAGSFGADLTWLGWDPGPYHDYYPLQTNETEDDYSQLVALINILNNTPAADLPAQIEPVLDVESTLYALALNNLFVNLDSYHASAHNYYLYDRDDTGQFTHIHWDSNEAFGRFRHFTEPGANLLELDPFWLPFAPPPQPPQERPLMENLWAVDAYSHTYLRALARMLREGFDVTTMEQRINELADLIRPDVYADANKMYSDALFEQNLYSDVSSGNEVIFGLRRFVQARAAYLDAELDTYARQTDLQLNELMAVNTGTVQDDAGDYDPWLEIYNLGPGLVDLAGLYLTDDAADPTRWPLSTESLDDGEFQLLWLDGEPGEGADHAPFSLQSGGGTLYLYLDDGTLVNSVTYPALGANVSWGRRDEYSGPWEQNEQPTPGAPNAPAAAPITLFINEFMADNDSVVEDPDEPGEYPDWIEVYNPGAADVDLQGLYLTDDLIDPTQHQITQTLAVPAGGFVLLYADGEPEQGPAHLDFKLSADGEDVALFADGVTLIDSYTFGPQTTDVAEGRCPDSSDTWRFYANSTPGASNGTCSASRVFLPLILRGF